MSDRNKFIEEANLKRNVTRKIKDLKAFRVKSDYQNIEISKEDSIKCNKLSLEVVKNIKTYLS